MILLINIDILLDYLNDLSESKKNINENEKEYFMKTILIVFI